jgi:hypothetical protein
VESAKQGSLERLRQEYREELETQEALSQSLNEKLQADEQDSQLQVALLASFEVRKGLEDKIKLVKRKLEGWISLLTRNS